MATDKNMLKIDDKVTKVRIKLIRSPIGCKPVHRRTLVALGLCRLGQSIEKKSSPEIVGMINQVLYLLEIESGDER